MDDSAVRRRALDPTASFIVQAPAGSGKTELLIQRYLKLLSSVESPEAIVAVTFTKKAAAEMRLRVLDALRTAAAGVVPDAPHQAETFRLATAALARDAEARWRLLENPARMRVQTIDALSASITRQMPWLARFGDMPKITEKSRGLYREAARNLLRTVEDEERSGIAGPLSVLLIHLDNDFNRAEGLLADMLEKRDQWLRLTGVDPNLEQVRAGLERNLAKRIARELDALRDSIPAGIAADLGTLPETVSEWLNVAEAVLTKSGTLRKKADPAVLRLIANIERAPGLAARLHNVRNLPPSCFENSQWRAMEALLAVLPRAVAELQLVFRERGRVDFAELSIRALDALGHLESPTDLGLSLGYGIQHLLVDEFQDTSYTQFDLIRKLTSGWEPRDGRTLFLVGDPLQSIYRFRQADVSLFLKARREGIGELRLEPLTLKTNFRSGPVIVDWVNETFSAILPAEEDIARGTVAYTPSEAHQRRAESSATLVVHAFLGEAQGAEAERVVSLVRSAVGSIAILVRARSHLLSVTGELRRQGIPFQAIEIDQLGERAIIQDLMALTFALTHLADRISWLAILRAPWCGFAIEDLHALAGSDPYSTVWDLLHGETHSLTNDGATRLARCLPIFENAVANRGRIPLRRLVEQTWLNLGGPAVMEDDSGLADASAYFDLLEEMEEAGGLENFENLREQVIELFSQPDPHAGGRLQIMTIHKAKGLEFDTVILPGLGQLVAREEDRLLVWQEQAGELLLAPMSASGEDADPIYKYIKRLEDQKGEQEFARLLYVAATRARNHLHLLGCAKVGDKDGELKPAGFLKLLWPAVEEHFIRKAAALAALPIQGAAANSVKPARLVWRLPANWTLPAHPAPLTWARETLERGANPEIKFEWVSDSLRHAGTVLHAYLQRIAAQGLDQWDAAKITGSRVAIKSMLANFGVSPLELSETAERVEKTLQRTIRDAQGRWILARHPEAACEYAITGLVDGKAYQARIDRTFVDERGVRWIIDYKSSLHGVSGLDNFLDEERRRYAQRMERYARLFAQRESRPIRLALYFPLLNAWREWAAPIVKRRQASLFD